MAEDKPAFTKGYGEAKEDKMSAQAEREAVGLTPEEVREINKPKSPPSSLGKLGTTEGRGKSKIDRAANVLAASLTAAAGVGLAAAVLLTEVL